MELSVQLHAAATLSREKGSRYECNKQLVGPHSWCVRRDDGSIATDGNQAATPRYFTPQPFRRVTGSHAVLPRTVYPLLCITNEGVKSGTVVDGHLHDKCQILPYLKTLCPSKVLLL